MLRYSSGYNDENELQLDDNANDKVITHLGGFGTTYREYYPAVSDNNGICNSSDDTVIFATHTHTHTLNTEKSNKYNSLLITDGETASKFFHESILAGFKE
jgi:hypothetical protein